MRYTSKVRVDSPNVRYTTDYIESDYEYSYVQVKDEDKQLRAFPMKSLITFRTSTKVPKLGLMLVGLGGNNGTTVLASILANRHQMSWSTKDGEVKANYFGSLVLASTVSIGRDSSGVERFVPMKDLVPMVDPNEIVIDGWDISSMNCGDAMKRSKVLDVVLQEKLYKMMTEYKPRKAIFDLDWVAENQKIRADNVISGKNKWQQVEQIRADIREFEAKHNLDSVIVLWTANTERYTDVGEIHQTSESLMDAIKNDEKEISPSTLYAVASILEGVTYINGSPQNTFVPGLIDMAEKHNVFIAGDDFKSGQTKFKSVLVDFLVSAGIKPCAIVSYNHLGNNDGYNLSAPKQFRSKEISKSNVVDDMVASNQLLYGQGKEHPDHVVVIKYVPYVADSKRAMDEYTSELMLGGRNTIVVHNTCEDSLLASPLILDLALLAELCQRVQFKVRSDLSDESTIGSKPVKPVFQKFNAVLSLLSYMLKAPHFEKDTPVVNSLFKQRCAIENMLRALIALPPVDHLNLPSKLSLRDQWAAQMQPSIAQAKKQQPGIIQTNGTINAYY